MLECVLNLSEGARLDVVAQLAATAGDALLDVHSDADHNRSVLTLVGEDSPRAVTRAAVEVLDLRTHTGVHPRIGVVDVVPFVPLGDATLADAEAAADRFAAWAGERAWPCRASATARSGRSPRSAAAPSSPSGPTSGHRRPIRAPERWRWALDRCSWPTTCGCAEPDLDVARALARDLRSPAVRALGLAVGRPGAGVDEPDRPHLGGTGPGVRRGRRPRSRWPAPNSSGWCPAPCCRTVDREPVAAPRSQRGAHDRGAPRGPGCAAG